jgi:hypothetical protein
MRISSLFVVVVAVVMLAGCGGGMNSSNSDAPKANNAHQTSWVAYHRDSLLNPNGATYYSNGLPVIDGILLNEHVTQCRVCHGPNLNGPYEPQRYKGYACLSCHVLDPLQYPVMCFSCHGGWPVVPTQKLITDVTFMNNLQNSGAWPVNPLQQWYSTVRSTRSTIPMFTPAQITKGIHQKHKAIPNLPYDATLNDNQLALNAECKVCHGTQADIGAKHHALLGQTIIVGGNPVQITGCFTPLVPPPGVPGGGCHTIVPAPGGGFNLKTDCILCHTNGAPA